MTKAREQEEEVDRQIAVVHQLDKAVVECKYFETMENDDGKGSYATEAVQDLIVGLELR